MRREANDPALSCCCNESPHESAHERECTPPGGVASTGATITMLQAARNADDRWRAQLTEKLSQVALSSPPRRSFEADYHHHHHRCEEEEEQQQHHEHALEEELPDQQQQALEPSRQELHQQQQPDPSTQNAHRPQRPSDNDGDDAQQQQQHQQQQQPTPPPPPPPPVGLVLKHQRWGDVKEKHERHLKWLSPSEEKNHRPQWWPMLTPHIVADAQLKGVTNHHGTAGGRRPRRHSMSDNYIPRSSNILNNVSNNNNNDAGGRGGGGDNDSTGSLKMQLRYNAPGGGSVDDEEIRIKRVHFQCDDDKTASDRDKKPDWWPVVLPFVCAQPESATQKEKRVVHVIPNRAALLKINKNKNNNTNNNKRSSQRRAGACIRIQAVARSWLCRRRNHLRLLRIRRTIQEYEDNVAKPFSAVRIQAAVRGWQCRKNYRLMLEETLVEMEACIAKFAAMQIQAAVRGWRCREKRFNVERLAFLERALADSQRRKEVELRQIQERKAREMAALEQEHARAVAESARLDFVLQGQAFRVKEAETAIQELLEANAAFEEQNELIQSKCDELREQNERIERQQVERERQLKSEIARLEKENETWEAVLQKQEANVAKCNAAIRQRKQYRSSERRICCNYKDAINEIAEHVMGSCTDEDIVGTVMGQVFCMETTEETTSTTSSSSSSSSSLSLTPSQQQQQQQQQSG